MEKGPGREGVGAERLHIQTIPSLSNFACGESEPQESLAIEVGVAGLDGYNPSRLKELDLKCNGPTR